VCVRWSSGAYAALPGVLAQLPSLRQIYLALSPDLPVAVLDAFLEGMAGLTHLTSVMYDAGMGEVLADP
jgi:hypothetical protein